MTGYSIILFGQFSAALIPQGLIFAAAASKG